MRCRRRPEAATLGLDAVALGIDLVVSSSGAVAARVFVGRLHEGFL
jgi:hypothetical protein